jgi:hypothetical protein
MGEEILWQIAMHPDWVKVYIISIASNNKIITRNEIHNNYTAVKS